MESRIMQVFYGNDCLPYKDKERQVHYPVVGNSFTGASDTTKIRFYVKDIGGVENVTWVAVVKLPNGKIGFKVLSAIGNDLEVGERYIEFSLNSFYTQYNGDLAIALKGYQGNIQVEEDDQTGIYEIVGTPTIQTTGVIKLSVNYSTQLPVTQGFSPDELIQLMALIAEKLNIASGIVVLLNDDEDISGYENGQLFYVVSRNQFMQLVENELEEKELNVYNLVPGQQATMSIVANTLTNVNGRVLSAYESQIVIINDFQCYKITRGGENLTEEYASRYMEYMTGSKYLPKYDYEHPQNTYFITPSGLILKPQYDSTNGLLLYPMSNLATRDYVNNDILEITDASTPLTYEQRQKILTNNVRIKYNNFYYEKVNHLGHNVRFECADFLFTTNADGSTTISQHFIVIRDNTGSISANTRELVTYSKAQADQIFANNVEMSVDSNYVLKVKLIDKNGEQLAEDSVDLPLESIVQSAQYYETYTYQGTTYENVIVITLATTEVPTIIPVGDLVSGLVSEATFNQGMATKVDKTNSANKVYGTNGSGSQATFDIDNNVSGNVVRRDSNSQIKVPLVPTSNDDATSKDYVDTFAKDVALSLDQSTYVLTVTLKNANGGNIVSRTVDLPLETMVVSGSYDETNKAIVLVLKNGQTISIPVGDLVSGLVSTDYLQTYYYNKTQINEMVSGFVFADVDDHLSSVSANPVENRVITLALEEKANVDGNYPTLTSGLADNLTPYSEDSGAEQEKPFISNGTGTNNNTEIVTVGDYALFKEKQGNTVVVNQLAENRTYTNDVVDTADRLAFRVRLHKDGSYVSGGTIADKTFTAPGNASGIVTLPNLDFNEIWFIHNGSTRNINIAKTVGGNIKPGDKIFYYVNFTSIDVTSVGGLVAKDIQITNLTQLFNGNIPQDILDNPSHLSWYYNGDLSHNTGSIENANGVKLVSTKRNLFDGTNDFFVTPNKPYYCYGTATITYKDKDGNTISSESVTNTTFTTPSNCVIVGASGSGQITISPYYTPEEGGEGYNKHYPYEEPYVVDTGNEILRSVLDIRDSKEPNRKITKRVGRVDLGSLNYDRILIGSYYYFRSPTNLQGSINYKENTNKIECAIYNRVNYGNQITDNNFPNMSIAGSTIGGSGGYFYIRNDAYTSATAFKSAMSGTMLYYELAEPTTEQGTSFAENLPINDYGMLYWLDSNNNLVGIPQGAKIFYPVNYKGFVDDVYARTDGDASKIALKSDLLVHKDTTRLTQTLVLTGDNSETWETSGTYPNIKRFNLIGTFPRYFDTEHPRGIGTATSQGLTINWIQDSGFANITSLSACFYGGTGATVPQLILLIPNSENVSTVEQLRTWLANHNITIEYEYSKYKLVATLLNGVVTYAWEKD